MKQKLLILAGFLLLYVGCARGVQKGDLIAVRISTPRPAATSGSRAVCPLYVSTFTATSPTFGSVSVDAYAEAEDQNYIPNLPAGDPVLTFSGTPTLELQASDDWTISYIGASEVDCGATGIGNSVYLSYGTTETLNLNESTTIPITIGTHITPFDTTVLSTPIAGYFIQGSLQIIASNNPCIGSIQLMLADGTPLMRAGMSFSVSGSGTSTIPLDPLPVNTALIATITQVGPPTTIDIPFTTGSTSPEIISTSATGFCP